MQKKKKKYPKKTGTPMLKKAKKIMPEHNKMYQV